MAATIYARAKAVIQERGWHQGDITAGTGICAVCLQGALHVACHGHPYVGTEPVCEGYAAIRKIGNHLCRGTATWNDEPGRTVDEVCALLDEMDRLEREAVGA